MCELSKLVCAATAFGCWVDLCEAIRGGYVPTLFGKNRRERLLRKCIQATFGAGAVWPKNVTG